MEDKVKDESVATIPYFCHEGEVCRLERRIKRLHAILFAITVIAIVSNRHIAK